MNEVCPAGSEEAIPLYILEFVKIVRRAQGAILLVVATVVIHLVFSFSHFSFQHDLMPTAASVTVLILALCLMAWITIRQERTKRTETLEVSRRALVILVKGKPPFALAWKMIREAELEPSPPQYWRFVKKTGDSVFLREENCSRQQWTKLSDEIHRKLTARKVPVTVLLSRRSDQGQESRVS